jgi:putative FmdB family regulatory protein
MPLYEYRCSHCGQNFELLRKMGDADTGLECPKCQSSQVSRQLSTFAPHMGSPAGATAPCGAPAGSCGGGHCQFQQ